MFVQYPLSIILPFVASIITILTNKAYIMVFIYRKFNKISTYYGEIAYGLGFLTLLTCNVLYSESKLSCILIPKSSPLSTHSPIIKELLATDSLHYISCLENVSNHNILRYISAPVTVNIITFSVSCIF